jgi:hypothetical protein
VAEEMQSCHIRREDPLGPYNSRDGTLRAN